jgi:hypothetical protein
LVIFGKNAQRNKEKNMAKNKAGLLNRSPELLSKFLPSLFLLTLTLPYQSLIPHIPKTIELSEIRGTITS